MVGKVARVLVMLEDYGKGHGVVCLLFLHGESFTGVLAGGDATKVVVVVGDLCACPDPALLVQAVSSGGEHEWLHAVVELAVWLLAVDDVEAIGDAWFVF